MTYMAQVLVGMLVMAVVDIPMIKYVIQPMLSKYADSLVAKRPDVIAALIFYVGYVALVVFLSQRNADTLKQVALNGAFLGLLAYGTYEFTNKAVLDGWPWQMVVIDVLWGVVLTTVVASSTYYLFNR